MMLQAILKTAEENKATQIIGERCWSVDRMQKVRAIEKGADQAPDKTECGFFRCAFDNSITEDFLKDVIRLVIYNDNWQLYAIREPGQEKFIVSENTGNEKGKPYQTLAMAKRYGYARRLGIMDMIDESVTIVETTEGTWRVKDVCK